MIIIKKKQAVIQEYIEKLLNEKESFKHIFETENGSIYFVAPDDKSWRIKKDKNEYEVSPVMKKIIFVNEKSLKRIIRLFNDSINAEYLIGKKILKSEICEGARPFEFGLMGYPDAVYEEDERFLTLRGCKLGDGGVDNEYIPGLHMGHKIVKIY